MIKKILVPLDGSELAARALPYAEEMAQLFKAQVVLCWVLHPPVIMSDYGYVSYDQHLKAEREEADNYLSAVGQGFLKHNLSVRSLVVSGQSAALTIIDIACQEEAGLIVMSSHGRSGLSRWVHGSVAEKVLQSAPCPVLLIGPDEPLS